MLKTVIKAQNISKIYRIGIKDRGLLSERITNSIKTLFYRNGYSEKFNAFWALQDINFEVKEGEIIGIIGKNGAGKSTLLKIISRITVPTTGKITINGRVASLLEVGTGFHPELTGRENIYMNGLILGMKRSEVTRKLSDIIAFSGVEQFIDTPVKHYSSGMMTRLGFAVAAFLEPEILVIDEVLAVGDAEFQKKCVKKMESLASSEGRTILFVTHNLGIAENLCKTGFLLDKGKISMIGNIKDIITSYLSIFANSSIESESISNRMSRAFGDCIITDVKILNKQHQATNEFLFGDTIRISLNIKAMKYVKDGLSILIYIRDFIEKKVVTTLKKSLFKGVLEKEKVAQVEVEIYEPLLTSGTYDLYIWIGDYECHRPYDIIESSNIAGLFFKIVSKEEDVRINLGSYLQPFQVHSSF